jgi:hypothetical protein
MNSEVLLKKDVVPGVSVAPAGKSDTVQPAGCQSLLSPLRIHRQPVVYPDFTSFSGQKASYVTTQCYFRAILSAEKEST